MPHKVWAVGEEVLAADFNTFVQDQVVTTFPDIASLKAWAAPNGAMAWVDATNQHYWRRAGAWWTRASYYNATLTLNASEAAIAASGFGLAPIAGGHVNASYVVGFSPAVAWFAVRLAGTPGAWTQFVIRGYSYNSAGAMVAAPNATAVAAWGEAFGPIV